MEAEVDPDEDPVPVGVLRRMGVRGEMEEKEEDEDLRQLPHALENALVALGQVRAYATAIVVLSAAAVERVLGRRLVPVAREHAELLRLRLPCAPVAAAVVPVDLPRLWPDGGAD